MPVCVAFGCTNRSSNKSKEQVAVESSGIKITFHRFPGNAQKREEWIKAIRRDNWSPTESSRICSRHFKETDFDKTSLSCIRLRDWAIPSIFPAFPSYLQKDKIKNPRRLLKRKREAEISMPSISKQATTLLSSEEILPEIAIQPPVADLHLQKISRSTSISPSKKRLLESPTKKMMREAFARKQRKYQIKIKTLQQARIRDKKTIASLKNMITELKKQMFIRNR